MIRIALIAALFVAPAFAQTSTNCSTVGNYTNCQTYPGGTVPPVDYSSRTAPPAPVVQPYDPARRADRRARQVRKDVANLVAAGDCDAARSYALSEGDLSAAADVQRLCSK